MYFYGELDDMARHQWGLVTRRQALTVVTSRQLDRLRARKSLIPVHYGVYRLAGTPGSWRQRAMASCLAYEAPVALSHRAAARLWNLEDIKADDPEVTITSGRSGRRGGILTHRAALSDSEVLSRQGIPVTSPERTLVDLATMFSPKLLERVVDQALRRHLVTVDKLERCHARRSGSGWPGSATMREILEFRKNYPGMGDSDWVDRIVRWIEAAGLDVPVRQHQVIINGTVRVLDMAHVEEKIAIEFAGYDAHGRRHRFDSDAVRTSELALAGWLVVTVTSKRTAEEVVRWVREALELRRTD
jgi:very-short-patch-repair endonuclease